jgi:potassium channel subfamily K, other eukaryote
MSQKIFTDAQGTFGPVASAFNVCALTQGWRESTLSDETEDQGINIPNPTW